ncbi:hypothetical protein [Aeoliella mucimassa]|nr:hypothetical protein [Aeoliella mucimassa]
MHWLELRKPSAGEVVHQGVTTYRALPGPIRDFSDPSEQSENSAILGEYVWPFGEDDWLTIDTWPGHRPLESLSCHYCQNSGSLISLEHPTLDGRWPIFRNQQDEYHCPVCQGNLELLYDVTIN